MAQIQMSANVKTINAVFAAMLVGTVGYFIYWGLGYTHYNYAALFIIATMFGVFMAFNIGGNDVANSFGIKRRCRHADHPAGFADCGGI